VDRQVPSSLSHQRTRIEDEVESQEEGLESLRWEFRRQQHSFDGKVDAVTCRVDELRREFEILRGEVTAFHSSVGGEIGKVKSDGEAVAQSVSALESLRPELNHIKSTVQKLEADLTRMEIDSQDVIGTFKSLHQGVIDLPGEKRLRQVEIPMKAAKSLDGMISYLTKKHGGNVQEKGIVTITSKSVYRRGQRYALSNVADLTSDSRFCSEDASAEWICWDFREMRIRPTHYTMKGVLLKSWAIEGSIDGKSWMEIDRQTDNQDFKKDAHQASFAFSKPAEFRFIRMTQTGKNHFGDDSLALCAVEFFGTLLE
jgi:hypothetical protein